MYNEWEKGASEGKGEGKGGDKGEEGRVRERKMKGKGGERGEGAESPLYAVCNVLTSCLICSSPYAAVK